MSEDKLNKDFKSKTITEDQILLEKILLPLDLRHDLLIEHLHKIQDYFGFLSEKNLALLAKILKVSKVEVYEKEFFYVQSYKNERIFKRKY